MEDIVGDKVQANNFSYIMLSTCFLKTLNVCEVRPFPHSFFKMDNVWHGSFSGMNRVVQLDAVSAAISNALLATDSHFNYRYSYLELQILMPLFKKQYVTSFLPLFYNMIFLKTTCCSVN